MLEVTCILEVDNCFAPETQGFLMECRTTTGDVENFLLFFMSGNKSVCVFTLQDRDTTADYGREAGR